MTTLNFLRMSWYADDLHLLSTFKRSDSVSSPCRCRVFSILLLCLTLFVGVGNVWGADPTISWAFKTLHTTSGTQDGITWVTGKTGSPSNTACDETNGLVLYGVTNGGGYFQTTSAISGTITNVNIVSTAKKNTPKYTVYCSADGSNWTAIASDQTAGTNDHAVTGSYTYVKVANTTAATAQLAVTSISVTYTPASTGDVIVKTLKSIAVEGMTTSYETGDAFSFNGTCTATYSVTKNDVPQADESKSVTPTSVTSPDMSSAGEKTITVSYTESEVTKTTTYNINVAAVTKSSLIFTESYASGGATASDDAEWVVESDGEESSFDSQNGKGIHYGTSGAAVQYIQLSTSDISGTITKVVVNASTANSVTATVSVTVGGEAFGGAAQSLTTSAAEYTFTGSASGEIVVLITKPESATKAIYCKSVVVSYESCNELGSIKGSFLGTTHFGALSPEKFRPERP